MVEGNGANVALVDADVQGSSSLWLKETGIEIPVFRLQSADEVLDGVPEIGRSFEHLVVDGPAGLSEVTRAILLVADLALLPCGPSVLDLRAATAREVLQGADPEIRISRHRRKIVDDAQGRRSGRLRDRRAAFDRQRRIARPFVPRAEIHAHVFHACVLQGHESVGGARALEAV